MIGFHPILYFHTLRQLHWRQFLGRFRNLYRRPPREISSRARRPEKPIDAIIPRHKSLLGENRFSLLNQQTMLTFPAGWNDGSRSKLWLYNLHYFEGLLDPDCDRELKEQLVTQWIEQNSPAEGVGWEPYPLSLRLTNWIKWHLTDDALPAEAVDSLALQADFLSKNLEYHLLGNHLLANAKALVFAGCFLEGLEPQKWLKKGLSILREQISEQFLADGGHFELSPTYHTLLSEDLLDIINICRAYGIKIPASWMSAASRALEWLNVMTRPDGKVPLFNDAAYGTTPESRSLMKYAERLGIAAAANQIGGLRDLAESGYFRFDGTNYTLIGDAGQIGPDYIPGHAHCDMLNFELFANNAPFVVDTGTSTYERGKRRTLERSVESHNTVQIGDGDQSETWAAFRMARRARVISRAADEDRLTAAILDYRKNRHERCFKFSDKSITIIDRIYPAKTGTRSVARLHLHPSVEAWLEGHVVSCGSESIIFRNDRRIWLEEYCYAPEFNRLVPAVVICAEFEATLETRIQL